MEVNPGGENHSRPSRPCPAVWVSAITTVPFAAPSWANCAATSWVDPSSA